MISKKTMAIPIILTAMMFLAIFPAIVSADDPMPRMAFVHDPADGDGLYINHDAPNGTVKVYGEDDVGPKGIYSWYKDPFNPAVIEKDSLTFDPAIMLWDGQEYAMHGMHEGASKNLDEKKFLRLWYEPAHIYKGLIDNYTQKQEGSYRTIEIETTYMLIDTQHKLPVSCSAPNTEFLFPLAEIAGQSGLGSFDGNLNSTTMVSLDDRADLVNLVNVSGSTGRFNKTLNGTIDIEHQFRMEPGEVVQFLDHKLKLDAIVRTGPDEWQAEVIIWYAGNMGDDTPRNAILDRTSNTYYDRHNNKFATPKHPDRTWHAQAGTFGWQGDFVNVIVGKEIAAGDTFYVNGMRYDVPAIEVIDVTGDGAADEFKFITLRTPIPKCYTSSRRDESIVSSQWVVPVCKNDTIPLNPPFNHRHDIVDDTDVALWKPNNHVDTWPTGPYPEGERYLTMQKPPDAWINYFDAKKIGGATKWIAYDVESRIILNVTPLEFWFVKEELEPRYSSDLLEILCETFSPDAPPQERWQKYVLMTMPERYTEFYLPEQKDVLTPPLTLNGSYILVTSFYAPNSNGTEHNITDPATGMPRVAAAIEPSLNDSIHDQDFYVNEGGRNSTIRVYGEDDIGPNGTYSWYKDPFNPAVIKKDSVTFNPAIMLWDGQEYAMHGMHEGASKNLDEKKFLRLWYEPANIYEGLIDNYTQKQEGPYRTIVIETTYMLIDTQHKLPVSCSAPNTEFLFPLAEIAGQSGLGSFDGNLNNTTPDMVSLDDKADLVNLVKVSGSTGRFNKTLNGTIDIEHQFKMAPGEVVQFLDHKLRLDAIVRTGPNTWRAHVTIWYAGNVGDDTERSKILNLVANTYYDRHNNEFNAPKHPDRTWHARAGTFGISGEFVNVIVGKEIATGDTFYVNGTRYDVPAIEIVDVNGDGAADEFKFITLRTPIPKCYTSPQRDESIVSSQWVVPVCKNDTIPLNPPFNHRHDIVDDTDVALWKPNNHVDTWPTGPYPEGERYLTMQKPPDAWINYFDAKKIGGATKWIAYDVESRIIEDVDPLVFWFVKEELEPRYSSDLLEILCETFFANEPPYEEWQKYVLRTMPDRYTEFMLPEQPDVATPPLNLTGDYIVVTSFYAPNSIGTEHNICEPIKGDEVLLEWMEGDATCNGRVTGADAMVIEQYVVGIRTLNATQLMCADTTDDGKVTGADAMHIKQWVVDPTGALGVLAKPLWESPADDDLLKPE